MDDGAKYLRVKNAKVQKCTARVVGSLIAPAVFLNEIINIENKKAMFCPHIKKNKEKQIA